jgi:hypothetical protein
LHLRIHSKRNPSHKIIVSEWAILPQVSFSNLISPPLSLLPPPSSGAKARKRASFVKDKLRTSVFDDATTAAAVAGEKGGGAAAGGPPRLPRAVRRVKIELITRIWSIFEIFEVEI